MERLLDYFERIERLEEEKRKISSRIREVFADAKGNGYDVKAIKQVLRLRKMAIPDRQEQDYIVQEYRSVLGV